MSRCSTLLSAFTSGPPHPVLLLAAVPFSPNTAIPNYSQIPAHRVLFLYIEPFLTIVGAFFAHFRQHAYLDLTNAPSAPNQSTKIPLGTTVVLSQLANLYLLFAINEALVLRSTRDLRVWNTLLSGLLLADFGHLYSLAPLGLDIYWKIWTWNAMDWGNVGFVYLGAASRILFLCGFGLNRYGRNGAVDTSSANKILRTKKFSVMWSVFNLWLSTSSH